MTKTAAVDFAALDTAQASEKPFEFELLHPASKAPLGVFLSVLGPESAAFKEKARKETNRARRRRFEERRKGKETEPTTIEQDETMLIEMVAELIVSWRTVTDGKSEPVIIWEGQRLECTKENAIRWLTRFEWARKQVDDASGDLENFMPG